MSGLRLHASTVRARRRRAAPPATSVLPTFGRIDAYDGLRALAVLLVVAFHTGVPGAWGGFLGVDVFFVLSGFLITSLLLREATATGRINIGRFWTRRVLRLLPAALVMLLIVGGVTALGGDPDHLESLGTDLWWSLLYVANWHFINSTSYFADDGTVSPFLHLWSLAVEEQFYLLWPLIITAVLWRRRTTPRGAHASRTWGVTRLLTIGVLAAIIVSALLMASLYTPLAPERAYMGTDTKMFQPLLGALAACTLHWERVRYWARWWATWLVTLGALGLLTALCLVADDLGLTPWYYTGGAVLAATSVALLVMGMAYLPPTTRWARLWHWPPLVYLGRISYAIYLWHWPFTLWVGAHGDTFYPLRALLVLAASIGAASLSYHVVEHPLRHRFTTLRPALILTSAAALVAASLAAVHTTAGSPLTPRTVDAITDSVAAHHIVLTADGATTTRPGGGLLVIGDSVPQRMSKHLAAEARRRGLPYTSVARGGCSGLDIESRAFPTLNCRGTAIASQIDAISRRRPDIVLWWSRWELAPRVDAHGHTTEPTQNDFWTRQQTLLDAAIARLTTHGATLLIVEPERPGTLITRMYDRGVPGDLAAALLDRPTNVRQRWTTMLRATAAHHPHVHTTTIEPLICRTANNPCDDRWPIRKTATSAFPPAEGNRYARTDGEHFGPEARDALVPILIDRCLALVPSAGSR